MFGKAKFDNETAFQNDQIGTRLVSKTPAMSIWHIRLAPGETLPPHRHDRPYFWTVLTDGQGRASYDDGRVVDVTYTAGDTQHHDQYLSNRFAHDLTNNGASDLVFVTVEFNIQER